MIWASALALASLVAALGFWGWKQTSDATAFFAAGRRAGALLAGLGGTAAGLSAFAFIGGPGLFSAIGAASLWIVLSAPLTGVLQCWAVGEPIVELARTRGCVTIPELVAARFGSGLPQLFTAFAVLFGGIATLSVQLKGLAILGEVLLDWAPLALPLTVLSATLVYTAAGGMRAGLWAEATQGVIMAVAAVIVAAFALSAAGGPSAALDLVAAQRPHLLQAWTRDGEVIGLGWMLLFLIGTCAQPHYLQKFLFLRDRNALRWMPMVMTVSLVAVLTVWVGVGLGGVALTISGDIAVDHPDQLAPAILRLLGGPLMALATLAIVAAVMSTTTSLLTLTSAAVTRDIPSALGRRTPARSLFSARTATILIGFLSLLLATFSGRQIAFLGILGWGMFTATLLPVMLIGLRWADASRLGALAAIAVGATVQVGLEVLRMLQLATIQRWEPGLSGAAAATLALVAISWTRPDITASAPETTHADAPTGDLP